MILRFIGKGTATERDQGAHLSSCLACAIATGPEEHLLPLSSLHHYLTIKKSDGNQNTCLYALHKQQRSLYLFQKEVCPLTSLCCSAAVEINLDA